MLLTQYRAAVARGELRPDAAQENAVHRLDHLARALAEKRGFSLFGKGLPPHRARPLYLGRCRARQDPC